MSLAKPKPKVTLGSRATVVYAISYDPKQPLNRAFLSLYRWPWQNISRWSVKLDFSASKAGAAGLVQLISAVNDILPLKFSTILPDFRVSRLDPAIDLIGAYPLDLIAHIENAGKRLVFVGDGGHPESIYLYAKKKPLKKPPEALGYNTRGALRLKAYERRDYFRQLMLDPPYGNCPVTRIEVELRWKKKTQRPWLADLVAIDNPLLGRRVAYAAQLAGNSKQPREWLTFCLSAFGAGVSTAQEKWQLGSGLAFRKTYEECAGDLVDASRWDGWEKGIASTGLDSWIKAATPKP